MNIQRLTSPQAMAVPSMSMSGRMAHEDHQSSRALPRAIPNARYDDAPGIPSMEAPSSIFRDIRDRLPRIPPPVEEDSTMKMDQPGSPGSPLKSGISSLKERMGGFDSMDVDMDRHHHGQETEVPPFAKIFTDTALTTSPLKEESASSEGPRTIPWRTHSSTNSLTNEGLQSEGSLQDAIKKSLSAYDDKLLRKLPSLTSPVSPSPASPARRNYHTLPRHFNPFSKSDRDGPMPPKSSDFNVSAIFEPPKTSTPRGAIPSFASPTTPSYKSPLNRWVNSGLPEGNEPRSAGFAESQSNKRPALMDYRDTEDRSPNNLTGDGASVSSYADDIEREQHRRSGSMSLLGQYEDVSGTSSPRRSSVERKSPRTENHEDDLQMDDMTGSQLRRLTITSRTSPRGMSSPSLTSLASPSTFRPFEKRRATSPPPEDRYTMSGVELPRNRFMPDPGNDLNRITMSGSRGFKSQSGPTSIGSRYTNPQYASFSSSQSTTWSSFTNGDQASSVTSYSPSSEVGASPSVSGGSPYMHPSPKPHRGSTSSYRGHARAQSDAVARQHASESAVGPKHHSAPKPFTAYLCECCPKKPKKFETQAELELHELEKQYTCAYCSHRFKNKNEAERHQNSLHLRKYSWSCAALSGVEAAFHPSPARPHMTDICGYCGDEFKNPADWDERTFHLTQVHKYGECNQHKKFYRADHFRQHLKHSHAGTSGKWANVLENACRREEVNPNSDTQLGTQDVISEEAG